MAFGSSTICSLLAPTPKPSSSSGRPRARKKALDAAASRTRSSMHTASCAPGARRSTLPSGSQSSSFEACVGPMRVSARQPVAVAGATPVRLWLSLITESPQPCLDCMRPPPSGRSWSKRTPTCSRWKASIVAGSAAAICRPTSRAGLASSMVTESSPSLLLGAGLPLLPRRARVPRRPAPARRRAPPCVCPARPRALRRAPRLPGP